MLQVGQRVRMMPENRVAEVYRVAERAGHYGVGLIFEDTRQAQEFVLTPQELTERLEVLPSLAEAFRARHEMPGRELCLARLEALRMHLAYAFDPHCAVSVTQVDLLPHQVDAVYRHILLQPKVRFLLADDPGLGKTIMAGLVLKELKARGLVQRVLIVLPAHLLPQWQREMQEWFREEFTVLSRGTLQNLWGPDSLARNLQMAVSLDFARQDEIRELLGQGRWDLLIVDEAHKLSATRYGKRVSKTKRYQLGEVLSGRCTHMLLLTATPHKGDDEAYFLLLNLLQPRLFACSEHLKESAAAAGLPFVLRRSKEQVTDLAGNKLFKQREVRTLSVSLTEAEQRLYHAVTEYVRRWYGRVSRQSDRRSRNVALALTVLQRRLSSSLFAVRESLRRRRTKLQNLLQQWERRLDKETLPELDDESWKDLSEQTAAEWEDFQEKLEGLTAADSPVELHEEIAELDDLIRLAHEAERAGEEAKVNELRRVVGEHLRNRPEEKLIVFTEFKDTLMALRRKVEQEWGFAVALIHGDMGLPERIEQERYFRDHAQILIGTDAAGEGLNLQFARLMLNFDLPWNPNRLEQRMGRIHRYGQTRDCYVFNMLYRDTCEGLVLERLMEKLQRMRQRLGDSVYDVISHVMEGIRLEELIMGAILRGDPSEVVRNLDVDLDQRLQQYREALQAGALADHHIDLSAVWGSERDSRLHRLVPWDVERFTQLAVRLVGGRLESLSRPPGVWRISLPPTFLRQHGLPGESFAQGVRIAFQRHTARDAKAEFFAPGHPVLDALVGQFLPNTSPVQAVLAHPAGAQGILGLFRAGVQDGEGQPVLQRLLALFWDAASRTWQEVDPRMVWDLDPWPDDAEIPADLLAALDSWQPAALDQVMEAMQRIRDEAAHRRKRQTHIKTSWLQRSFEHLIGESNDKLFEYRRRAEQGEDMAAAIRQEEENLKHLHHENKERLEAAQREEVLTLQEPRLEAVLLICGAAAGQAAPEQPHPDERRRIELLGMEVAMRYEREHGRQPLDVSKEFRGYDIRSEGPGEVRYIEVKSFATTGQVIVSPHEWQIAERLGDEYWLYKVEDARTEPRLETIQNPAKNFRVRAVTGVVHFILENSDDKVPD